MLKTVIDEQLNHSPFSWCMGQRLLTITTKKYISNNLPLLSSFQLWDLETVQINQIYLKPYRTYIAGRLQRSFVPEAELLLPHVVRELVALAARAYATPVVGSLGWVAAVLETAGVPAYAQLQVARAGLPLRMSLLTATRRRHQAAVLSHRAQQWCLRHTCQTSGCFKLYFHSWKVMIKLTTTVLFTVQ